MNIEELMNVEVTSVSGHEQSLSKTAAAIFVITEEEILRSGATNIRGLLRMVPGVQVAQINASSWAVSIRGFNGRFSNKVLVMVDGRTLYVPSFGGVFYEVLDVPLEQISRIEVIRGPGGSVWGTNAVNGVINILTKKASAIPDTTVVAGGSTTDRGAALLRQGGKLRGLGDFRVFAEYSTEGGVPRPAALWRKTAGTSCTAGFAPILRSPRRILSQRRATSIPGVRASPLFSLSPSFRLILMLPSRK
jgi:iron complex outermembrane recepter protein